MPSTLGRRREHSSPGGGLAGRRVRSTESENSRFLEAECQDAEYARPTTRTLVALRRICRMSSTLDGKRERSLPGGGVSGCRVLSADYENARCLEAEFLGCRVLSTESENARFLAAECQDAEYSRQTTRTLVAWRRSFQDVEYSRQKTRTLVSTF